MCRTLYTAQSQLLRPKQSDKQDTMLRLEEHDEKKTDQELRLTTENSKNLAPALCPHVLCEARRRFSLPGND